MPIDVNDEKSKELYMGSTESEETWLKLKELKLSDKQCAMLYYYFLEGHPAFQNRQVAYSEVFDGADVDRISAKLFRMPKIKKAIPIVKNFMKPEIFHGLYIKQEWLWQYKEAKKDGRHKDAINVLDKMTKVADLYGEGETKDTSGILDAKKAFAQVESELKLAKIK